MIFNIKETLDAKTLEGRGAEYFATAESMGKVNGQAILTEPITEKALSITTDGLYVFKLGGGNYSGSDLPYENYKSGQAIVMVRGGLATHENTTILLFGAHNALGSRQIAINYYTGSAWFGWQSYLTTMGGTLNGGLIFKSASSTNAINVFNSGDGFYIRNTTDNNNYVDFNLPKSGDAFIHKKVNGISTTYLLLRRDNFSEYALPLTGGSIKGTSETPLNIYNGSGSGVYVGLYNSSGTRLGYLGYSGADTPIFGMSDGTRVTALHTGNSAKTVISSTAPSDTTALWIDTSA